MPSRTKKRGACDRRSPTVYMPPYQIRIDNVGHIRVARAKLVSRIAKGPRRRAPLSPPSPAGLTHQRHKWPTQRTHDELNGLNAILYSFELCGLCDVLGREGCPLGSFAHTPNLCPNKMSESLATNRPQRLSHARGIGRRIANNTILFYHWNSISNQSCTLQLGWAQRNRIVINQHSHAKWSVCRSMPSGAGNHSWRMPLFR